MKHRADHILDIGERLIQTRGFNAFSYSDIAAELGIAKASIHYHFASKSELGAAIIARYRQRLEAAMAAAEAQTTSWALLELYFTPYLAFAETPDKVCLSGALAGEFPALPADMQAHVRGFFEDHQHWLAKVLARGQGAGEFRLACPPERMARLLFDALQGALLVKRATGDIDQLHDVISSFRSLLHG